MGKRKIRAKDVAQDIHAGKADPRSWEIRYLSAKQLETVSEEVGGADLIDHMQLYEGQPCPTHR